MKDRKFLNGRALMRVEAAYKRLTKRRGLHITRRMRRPPFTFPDSLPTVVGSIGDAPSLASATPESLSEECEIAEIRLDLLHREFSKKGRSLWAHLLPFPLLFTARCHAEGSPFDIRTADRIAIMEEALPDASLFDIEAMSVSEMTDLIRKIEAAAVPWIASYHDFEQMPSRSRLEARAEIAMEAGANAFKCAARLRTVEDLTALAGFQQSEQGIPLATMGMGDLGPVSRLLCAQSGSVLNYGFIGAKETAPGQWSAKKLRDGIRSLKTIF